MGQFPISKYDRAPGTNIFDAPRRHAPGMACSDMVGADGLEPPTLSV